MTYTKFRKSYGDFEVVIPPVKFQLPPEYAAHVAKELRSYEIGFVCNHLGGYVGGERSGESNTPQQGLFSQKENFDR